MNRNQFRIALGLILFLSLCSFVAFQFSSYEGLNHRVTKRLSLSDKNEELPFVIGPVARGSWGESWMLEIRTQETSSVGHSTISKECTMKIINLFIGEFNPEADLCPDNYNKYIVISRGVGALEGKGKMYYVVGNQLSEVVE